MSTSMSGLSEDEAREFHTFYLQGFILFTVIAVIAHFLVWAWRPWIPAEGGYSALEGVQTVAQTLTSLV